MLFSFFTFAWWRLFLPLWGAEYRHFLSVLFSKSDTEVNEKGEWTLHGAYSIRRASNYVHIQRCTGLNAKSRRQRKSFANRMFSLKIYKPIFYDWLDRCISFQIKASFQHLLQHVSNTCWARCQSGPLEHVNCSPHRKRKKILKFDCHIYIDSIQPTFPLFLKMLNFDKSFKNYNWTIAMNFR